MGFFVLLHKNFVRNMNGHTRSHMVTLLRQTGWYLFITKEGECVVEGDRMIGDRKPLQELYQQLHGVVERVGDLVN